MSLIERKPISIGRAVRKLRDDRVFVVAAEDTYAPEQYFAGLPLPRVKVVVISTPEGSGLSAPTHVVARLKEAFEATRRRQHIQSGDEFWVMLDTDHHVKGTNLKNLLPALQQARQLGFELAISNPCFELWLLLHHEEVTAGTVFDKSADVTAKLKNVLGGYDKTSVRTGRFALSQVPEAIRRARALESQPNDPEGDG